MTPPTVMLVAVDPSADGNAAALVRALAATLPGARFIGAGGPKMAEAGVDLSFNLTDHAAIGPVDAIKNLGAFRRRRRFLAELARSRKPEVIILVDSYSFNQPLAHAIRQFAALPGSNWSPKIVQYTSPQVWASRPGRADVLARNVDLLISLYPFEKDWYARRGTRLRVEFTGHPMFDSYPAPMANERPVEEPPIIVLLPGSRSDELKRHLPVMLEAARLIAAIRPVRFKLVAANDAMAERMRSAQIPRTLAVEIQSGKLAEALSAATLAITKTGTVSLECAYFGVPTLAMYKVSRLFYYIARPFITVKYLAMPNILADEPVFPEFIQDKATPQNLANASLELLADPGRRAEIRAKLRRITDSLGGPGATQRAAALIVQLFETV